jgi:hypothetical protein
LRQERSGNRKQRYSRNGGISIWADESFDRMGMKDKQSFGQWLKPEEQAEQVGRAVLT